MPGLKSCCQLYTDTLFCFGVRHKPSRTSQLGSKMKSTGDCPWSYLPIRSEHSIASISYTILIPGKIALQVVEGCEDKMSVLPGSIIHVPPSPEC